jgi:tetratricopeptide (TPR) repeat protein
MPRPLYLHIGLPKTGTSSIQRVMATHRPALRAQGVLFPNSPGWANHALLPASVLADPNALWDVHPGTWEGMRPAARLEKFRDEFAAEMAAAGSDITRVIISAEQCSSLLVCQPDVQALANLLRRWFDPIHVVVYLRRQDKHAASAYTQSLRVGIMKPPALPEGGPAELPQYDYGTILARWAAVFGDAAITVRIFERAALKDGDAVKDFCDICGIKLDKLDESPERNANPSVTLAGQALLHRAGAYLAAQAGETIWRDSPAWRRLTLCITEAMPGRGWSPTRAEAETFMARFAETNETARARFFPSRPALFQEGFEDLPDQPKSVPETEITEAALAALLHELAEGAKRQAEAALTQARLHRRLGEKPQQRNCLIRAIRFNPDLLEPRLALAELCWEDNDARQTLEHAEAALRIAPGHPKATRLERLAREKA